MSDNVKTFCWSSAYYFFVCFCSLKLTIKDLSSLHSYRLCTKIESYQKPKMY